MTKSKRIDEGTEYVMDKFPVIISRMANGRKISLCDCLRTFERSYVRVDQYACAVEEKGKPVCLIYGAYSEVYSEFERLSKGS